LGCRLGVQEAISWFFNHEEFGVILEDDVYPTQDFLDFCELMLRRYITDESIFSISGTSFLDVNDFASQSEYRMACVTNVWGWATWKRAWLEYKDELPSLWKPTVATSLFKALDRDPIAFAYWASIFLIMKIRADDTWDIQLAWTQLSSFKKTVVPFPSLCTNLGFDLRASHTKNAPIFLQPTRSLVLPCVEAPKEVQVRAEKQVHRMLLLNLAKSIVNRVR
jgi:hypothetical protein